MNLGTPIPHLWQEHLIILCQVIFKMGPCTYGGREQTPTNKNGEAWGAWEEPIEQIGFQATHAKQSKFYLLPQEPEVFDSKERLMVELSLHLYLINLRER